MRKLTDYEILNVAPDASLTDIKKAYYKLALIYHPDKNQDQDTTEQFKIIEGAYLRLTNRKTQTEEKINELEYDFRLKENQKYFSAKILKESILKEFNFNEKYTDIYQQYKKYFKLHKQKKSSIEYQNDFANINQTDLQKKIDHAVLKYSENEINNFQKSMPDLIRKKAFLWQAEKERCGTVLILSTIHVNFDFEDIFDDLILKTLTETDLVFTEIEFVTYSSYSTLDTYIAYLAAKFGKPLKALENSEIVKYIYNKQGIDLRQMLKNISSEAIKLSLGQVEQFLNFITFDIESLDPKLLPIPVHINRNKFWMQERILPASAAGTNILVACGAGHNCGRYGLPVLLAMEGYTVTPIIEKAPMSKKEIVRNMLSNAGLSFFNNNSNRTIDSKVTEHDNKKFLLTL